MMFTEEKTKDINNRLYEMKKAMPINGKLVGLGINIDTTMGKTSVYKNNWGLCDLDELGQMIKELTMLKQAVEEKTGLVL